MAAPLLLLLRSADWSDRWLAVSLALTAAAHGEPVWLALFGAALRDFAAGSLDAGAPAAAAAARVGSLAAMVEEGRRDLGIRVVACDTAVRLEGLDPAALDGRLEVTSLPALWRGARGGRVVAL
jgi:hypothetical protein